MAATSRLPFLGDVDGAGVYKETGLNVGVTLPAVLRTAVFRVFSCPQAYIVACNIVLAAAGLRVYRFIEN